MLIVHAAALILLVQTRLRTLVGLTVQADDAVGAEGHIRENEGMQRIGTILQNVVRVPADDDASAFLRQLKNHAALDIPQEIGCGQAVHHAGNALGGESVGKQTAAGGMLAVLFHKLGGEAGFQGNLIDQLLVIEGNAQPLGDLVADGASAGTKFTANGDDFLFHKEPPSENALASPTCIIVKMLSNVKNWFARLGKSTMALSQSGFLPPYTRSISFRMSASAGQKVKFFVSLG